MEPTTVTEPIPVKELMQTLHRIGFPSEVILEKCFNYAVHQVGLRETLVQLEDAAKACGIHRDQVMAEYHKSSTPHIFLDGEKLA